MIEELLSKLSNSPIDTELHKLVTRLRTGNDIHKLALDLYYSDPKKESAKHRALELIVYDRVDRLLAQKKRGIGLST